MSLKYFFLIFVLTLLMTRGFLWLIPKHGPAIMGFQLHHYMYGLILVLLYIFVQKPVLLAIGTAWVADEIPLFFIFRTWNWPDDHWKQYHSIQSIISVFFIAVFLYLIFRFLWLPKGLTP